MMKTLLYKTLPVLALAALLWCLLQALLDYADRPSVYEDSLTGRCVHVEPWTSRDEAAGYSCQNLPPRYERVLVDHSWHTFPHVPTPGH